MNIVIVQRGNWEGIYIGGYLRYEKLVDKDEFTFTRVVVPVGTVRIDGERIKSGDSLPQKFEDL
jgi:hypothetical protein